LYDRTKKLTICTSNVRFYRVAVLRLTVDMGQKLRVTVE
jgi:hypothetical protein